MSEKQQIIEYGYKEDNGYGALCSKSSPLQLALRVCMKYNLDPDLNELKMIKTQLGLVPYITASGLRRITTPIVKSLETECIDFDKENRIPNWVIYRAEVETIDGRRFTGEGAFDDSEIVGKTKKTLHLMRTRAETRAVSRALRFLVKGLDIYDELPDEVKQNEIQIDKEELNKEITKRGEVIITKPIIDEKKGLMEDLLNEDLEVKEENNIPSIKLDTILADSEKEKKIGASKKSELEELLSLSVEENAPSNGFEGIDYLVPFLQNLMNNNGNVNPSIGDLLTHIRKRTKIAKYIWDWFCLLKQKKFIDRKVSDNSTAGKSSPPIILYEQFTKSILQVDVEKQKTEDTRWYELISEENQDILSAYMFYFLYSVYYYHIKEKSNDYPDKQLIARLYPSGIVHKWMVPVFKLQENIELPDWEDV